MIARKLRCSLEISLRTILICRGSAGGQRSKKRGCHRWLQPAATSLGLVAAGLAHYQQGFQKARGEGGRKAKESTLPWIMSIQGGLGDADRTDRREACCPSPRLEVSTNQHLKKKSA
jgi:hypothetical protein